MRRVRSPAGGLRRIREATHAAPARARRGIAKQSRGGFCVRVRQRRRRHHFPSSHRRATTTSTRRGERRSDAMSATLAGCQRAFATRPRFKTPKLT
mmetsp:Transcript_5305/g.20680  ORF Transcript_5305/g.20680 Transcript_5305/m.20680 type:complete len:96 (-) Transcript_5305:1151-1438(-)